MRFAFFSSAEQHHPTFSPFSTMTDYPCQYISFSTLHFSLRGLWREGASISDGKQSRGNLFQAGAIGSPILLFLARRFAGI
jgi:hypothetical protein